jgi:Phage capsid family
MNARTPIPLRPDPAALAARARKSLARALIASARACFEPDRDHHRVVEKMWPHDDAAALILKTARSPASTADTALLESVVSAAVLGATGAGAALLARGLVLSFGRAATITLPVLMADASHAAFVGEGAPVPVYSGNVGTPVTMEPHKVMALWTMTRELIDGSNAEVLIGEAAKRSVGLALDAHLFDSVAGDAVRPAGLRNAVAPLTATGGTDKFAAMLDDLNALLSAVAPVGGDVVLVANPARAKMMPARARGGTLPPILGSPSVAAADLIAVAVDGLAAALDSEITVEASKGATIHMETAPSPISAPGTPNVISTPVRSLFQTDSVGMRLRLPATWAVRHPSTVAWLTTTW